MANAESPASVLDASAVLALLNDEEGSEVVTDAIADGAAISVVNLAEVLSKVAERGDDPATAAAELRKAEGSKRALTIEPLTAADWRCARPPIDSGLAPTSRISSATMSAKSSSRSAASGLSFASH